MSFIARLSPYLLLLVAIAGTACSDSSSAPPTPSAVAVHSGSGQEGVVGAALATPIAVRVTDNGGNPVEDVTVSWNTNGGSVSPSSSSTNSDGVASAVWTLGTISGAQSASASVAAVTTNATFTATATPGPATSLSITQDTVKLLALPDSAFLTITSRDQYNNNITRAPTWVMTQAGVISINDAGRVLAQSNGIVKATATMDGVTDSVRVIVDNLPPAVVVQAPSSDGSFVTTDAQINLSGFSSDNSGLPALTWLSDAGGSGTISSAQNWNLNGLALVPGENRFRVIARDLVGHTDTATISITRNQGITFSAPPVVAPGGALVSTVTQVTARISFTLQPGAVLTTAQLVEVNAAGQVLSVLGAVLDNGLLANGDEILADGVHSGLVSINRATAGTLLLRVRAQLTVSGNAVTAFSAVFPFTVYQALTTQQVDQVLQIQGQAALQVDGANALTPDAAVGHIAQTLRADANVTSVQQLSPYVLEVKYQNGLTGAVVLSEEDLRGFGSSYGHSHTSTFGFQDTVRRNKPLIPVTSQTRGSLEPRSNMAIAGDHGVSGPEAHVVLNKRVLIYEPSQTEFSPFDEGNALNTMLSASDHGFQITHLKDGAANVAGLLTLTQYGIIILATHGGGGEIFLTGEVVNGTNAKTYEGLVKQGELYITTHVVVRRVFGVIKWKSSRQIFGVNSKLISSLPGRFPNSLVFANYCEGTKTANLSSKFLAKGALTYLGWSESVGSGIAKTAVIDIIGKFIGTEADDILDAFHPYFDAKNNASLQLVGSTETKLTKGLVNGSFDTGDRSGWTAVGDGRVISKLGPQNPTEGAHMAIISTGLGFTTASGSLSQTFTLGANDTNIELNFNFLSEEFLEFIGSQFQDFFNIKLVTPTGTVTLFSRNIDQVAAQFPLTLASPGIVFDRGDVYQTGWRFLSLDVSAHKGKTVTLILETGDVGDSIYDTAVLVDAIKVKAGGT